jgi:hypothetical protein
MQGYGKCSHLFTAKEVMKIIRDTGEQISCRQILVYLFILPVACVYIIEVMCYIQKSKKIWSRTEFHSYTT